MLYGESRGHEVTGSSSSQSERRHLQDAGNSLTTQRLCIEDDEESKKEMGRRSQWSGADSHRDVSIRRRSKTRGLATATLHTGLCQFPPRKLCSCAPLQLTVPMTQPLL